MDDVKAFPWLMLYAGIVSIKAHPRNEGGLELEQCAALADEALKQFERRFPSWHGSEPL